MTTVMATGGSTVHHAPLSKGEREKNSTHEELPWRWRGKKEEEKRMREKARER